jgi:hypothetical protein
MGATSLSLAPPDAEWMEKAACRGLSGLMDSTEERDEKLAKDVCRACPVWERCRAWTLSLPPSKDVAGVAGGLTEKERDRARRRRRRARPVNEPPKTCNGPCGETQAATEFYPRPSGKGGREAVCRTCRFEQKKAWRARKAEAVAP